MRGFTLIELIVVIAIIGVLAAILVPSIMGHVEQSKVASANANAKLAYTNSCIYCTKCEMKDHALVNAVVVSAHPLIWQGRTPPEYEYTGVSEDMGNALASMMGSPSSSAGYVTVNTFNGAVTETCWSKNLIDHYVGHYPEPAQKKDDIYTLE